MQVISLFSGVGGFEISAKAIGWDNVVSCEINSFCRRVLEYHYPEAYHHDDIHTLNYDTIKKNSRWNPHADTLICGGFPCQPYSHAGERKGTADNRHLWPEMLRIIREVKPKWIVGENVYGLTTWNEGLVFEQIHLDLESLGYEVQSYIVPACGVDAPHKRDRVWIVAYASSNGHESGGHRESGSTKGKAKIKENKRKWFWYDGGGNGKKGNATDSDNERLQGSKIKRSPGEFREKSHEQPAGHIFPDWENFPTQSPVCSGDDWFPGELHGITFPKWRNETIKAMGNAVVPQVVLQFFRSIDNYETKIHNNETVIFNFKG